MKLNLGCGNKTKLGYLGVDSFSCGAVDVMADLTSKLPFENNSIDEIWMDNVIEHIPDITKLMKEIHRISKADTLVTIITPHFASQASWRDPTHIHHLSFFSMDHFEKDNVAHYTGGGFKVIERRLSFGGLLGNIGRLIYKISAKEYEKNWCFIFRPSTLKFVIRVIK
ncbi:MAG: methyltransferase domain-containing protein [Gammaproteobacteria bacterium]